MKQKIAELQEKYADEFIITDPRDGWLRLQPKNPLYDNHPSTGQPAFLDYNIQLKDHRLNVRISDRSRNVHIRTNRGRSISHASYCGGMGIWQVSEDGEPQAFGDLSEHEKSMARDWLKSMDDYVLKKIPELEQLLSMF